MKRRKKLGQAMVEYVLLTILTMMLGLALAKFSTISYRDSVYKHWADIIAQPMPAPY